MISIRETQEVNEAIVREYYDDELRNHFDNIISYYKRYTSKDPQLTKFIVEAVAAGILRVKQKVDLPVYDRSRLPNEFFPEKCAYCDEKSTKRGLCYTKDCLRKNYQKALYYEDDGL